MGRARLLTVLAAAGAVLFGVPWAFLELQPFRHDAVSVEAARGCATGDNESMPDSFVQKWEKGELVIEAAERSYCDQVDGVSAQVVAGHVFLRLKYGKAERPPSACLCMNHTIVRLKGIDERVYSIHRIGFARLGG